MTALVCVSTYALAFPLPIGGYFNVGDVFVLLAGWLLGPWYGAVAAGLGASLADVFLGYTVYAPATFLLKGGVAILAWAVYAVTKKMISKEPLEENEKLMNTIKLDKDDYHLLRYYNMMVVNRPANVFLD